MTLARPLPRRLVALCMVSVYLSFGHGLWSGPILALPERVSAEPFNAFLYAACFPVFMNPIIDRYLVLYSFGTVW